VFWYCFACKRRPTTDFLAHRSVRDVAELPIAWDNIDEQRKEPCATCHRLAVVEYHHWAPSHLFGEEADYWPGSMLCRRCHERWHRIVTPLMSRPTAVSEIIESLPEESPVRVALERSEAERARCRARKVTPGEVQSWVQRKRAAGRAREEASPTEEAA
jgi:hypothetical protein